MRVTRGIEAVPVAEASDAMVRCGSGRIDSAWGEDGSGGATDAGSDDVAGAGANGGASIGTARP